MNPVLSFRVTGQPAPQGSKRHVGHGVMVESSKAVKPWRQDVVSAAQAAVDGVEWEPPRQAKALLIFGFRRPRSHYRTGRNAHLLRDAAPAYHSTKPDGDKLVRSTFDALTTAGVIRDDCTVVDFRAQKVYVPDSQPTGALVYLVAADAQLPIPEGPTP